MIVSPCVGLCSTTLGDRTCRGCQRADSEIHDWPGLSHDERRARLVALDSLREAVAGRYLQLLDSDAFDAQMRRHRIRSRSDQPGLSKAVELLRVGRDRIRDLRCYGLAPLGEARHLSVAELHDRIAADLASAAELRRISLADS
ncbi:DUF1289 domain-containing protein [Halomonas urumqiensis]|nr:DUF1289 domain-containing protein [Halomonas urumqiensis]